MTWICVGLQAFWLVLLMWTNHRSYIEGVWDGTHNQTIPPVVNALEELEKRGWKAN
jgi:hypothetical protein